MTLPPNLFSKYLTRFDELINKGEEIDKASASGIVFLDSNFQSLVEWKVQCISLLNQVVPPNSVHINLIEELKKPEEPNRVEWVYRSILRKWLSYLKAIKADFQEGFLGDLTLAIEAEIAADYMGQSEQLLSEGKSGRYDHVPAAVLAGAVLEKSLKTLCTKQTPPILTINAKGLPLTLNPLIDELKKVGVFNELKAKQLRAWADIRNAAAHGEFDNFNRSDVEGMIKGIGEFLATYIT